MLAAAREIAGTYQGKFPRQYEQIKALKGIGPYTAAAIASFAFNLPHAVLDGNVFRVLARYFGIETPIDSTAGKKQFGALAEELLPQGHSAAYNQAIMDFGAVVCKPQQPLCEECPLQKKCTAYHQQLVSLLPVKTKKIQVRKRYFNYLLVSHQQNIYIRKRTENDIWQNLHEFILIETEAPADITLLQSTNAFRRIFGQTAYEIEQISAAFRQQLTHQTIHSQFINISVQQALPLPGYLFVPRSSLNNYAFPKTITSFLESNRLRLF